MSSPESDNRFTGIFSQTAEWEDLPFATDENFSESDAVNKFWMRLEWLFEGIPHLEGMPATLIADLEPPDDQILDELERATLAFIADFSFIRGREMIRRGITSESAHAVWGLVEAYTLSCAAGIWTTALHRLAERFKDRDIHEIQNSFTGFVQTERAMEQAEAWFRLAVERAPQNTGGNPKDAQLPDRQVIAQNLQRLRHEKGWSVNALADKVGIDRKQVNRHLNGQRPHPDTLKVYADAFSVTVETLLTRRTVPNLSQAPPK